MDAFHQLQRPVTQLIGDCELVLQQSVSYEPPMYLFPELLPKVPEGTAHLSVGDAVSDAIDVDASSFNIAQLFHLSSAELLEGVEESQQGDGHGADVSPDAALQQPMVSLAFLLATNRLQVAGLTADVLQRGKFSSESIIEELLKLKDRAGLNDNEVKAIMSNHFINILAWRALKDVNNRVLSNEKKESALDWECHGVRQCEERVVDSNVNATSEGLRPSEDPWCSNLDLQPGVFVAANESNVEERIDLVNTLSRLYRHPWKSLQSQGVQTERFVPGVINETAPYIDPVKLPGALLDFENDLGWKPTQLEDSIKSHWVVRVTSSITEEVKVLLMNERFMHFGRNAGVTSAAHGTVTNVHVGLSSFTAHPELISPHHFSLALLPAKLTGTETECANNDDGDGCTKNFHLWLMNYGRNGVRVIGKQWTLGGMFRLEFGDILQPTDDISIVISSSTQPIKESQDGNICEELGEVVVKSEPGATLEE